MPPEMRLHPRTSLAGYMHADCYMYITKVRDKSHSVCSVR